MKESFNASQEAVEKQAAGKAETRNASRSLGDKILGRNKVDAVDVLQDAATEENRIMDREQVERNKEAVGGMAKEIASSPEFDNNFTETLTSVAYDEDDRRLEPGTKVIVDPHDPLRILTDLPENRLRFVRQGFSFGREARPIVDPEVLSVVYEQAKNLSADFKKQEIPSNLLFVLKSPAVDIEDRENKVGTPVIGDKFDFLLDTRENRIRFVKDGMKWKR